MDYLVLVPGENVMIMKAMNLRDARSITRDMLGVQRLPKGTIVKPYKESDWN